VSEAPHVEPMRIADRLERLRTLEPDRRSSAPPAPRSAKIELTSRCNYGCAFCPATLRDSPRHDMSWRLYTRIARELREAGVEQLGLFYIGESLLYPRLEESITYAKQDCRYPYVFLTTNGSLATAGRVHDLMRSGLDSLKFALNFADGRQIHRGAGVAPETLETIVRNVLAACDVRDEFEALTGKRCLVSASSLAYDAAQGARMDPLLARIAQRVDEHYWLPVYGRAADWASCTNGSGASSRISRKALPCWPLYTEAHVTADGRLSACPLDHGARFHMADLKSCSFSAAWHASAFRALREAHLQGEVAATPCADCVGYA
jgi:hypothetical protein